MDIKCGSTCTEYRCAFTELLRSTLYLPTACTASCRTLARAAGWQPQLPLHIMHGALPAAYAFAFGHT